jgi:hypothetical protein
LRPGNTLPESLRTRRLVAIGAALLAIPGLAFNLWPMLTGWGHWGTDYNQFYSASRLAGTGHLYDLDALRKIEAERGEEVPTARLPVVIYGHKVLGGLPYPVARSIWLASSLAALLAFAALWPGTRRLPMMLALAWSMPASVVLLYGQDVPFWLMSFAAALLLMERKRPWAAGVAFSLCICKFHLALGIPVMLVAQKRWKTLIGGAVAVAVWIACCFAVEGADWPLKYARISQVPELSPASVRMPNLHGLASWLPWPSAIEIVFAIAIVWLLWSFCRDTTELGMAGAAAAACGLLIGNHAYGGDCTLLIPLCILTLQREGVALWIKGLAIVLLTPLPVLLLISEKSFLGQGLIVAFVVTAILVARTKPIGQPVPVNLVEPSGNLDLTRLVCEGRQ